MKRLEAGSTAQVSSSKDDEASRICLLTVGVDLQIQNLLKRAFSAQFNILTTGDIPAVPELVRRHRPAIVLVDLETPSTSGMDLLERMVEVDSGIDIVLMGSDNSHETAAEAVQKGACDYLVKPISADVLKRRIAQLVEDAKRRQLTLALDQQLLAVCQYQGIIGRSPAMLEVFAKIRRISRHFRTVLVCGATGTGKELVARALHDLSPASQNKFVSYNCGAMVETLIESELFGHVKGAFTGANQDKVGGFEYADGGVLFLDEVGEMPLSAQARLLRVLQQQEVQRVGSPVVRKVDVRVIAATHRDLRTMVAQGRFRDDLYYRLSPLEIHLPTLADRKEDIQHLQRHFLDRFNKEYGKSIRGLTRRAQALLLKHSWPGNVRELENVLSHACIMADSDVIDVADLPDRFRDSRDARATDSEHTRLVTLDEAQRLYVLRVIAATKGDKVEAAKILGISRATLYRIVAAAGVPPPTRGLEHSGSDDQFEPF